MRRLTIRLFVVMALYYILTAITCFMWTFAVEQFVTITSNCDIAERILKTLAGVFLTLMGLIVFAISIRAYTSAQTRAVSPSYYYYQQYD